MLEDIESLSNPSGTKTGSDLQIPAIDSLQTQVDGWRRTRVRKHGSFSTKLRLVPRVLKFLRRSSIVWSMYGRTNQSSEVAPKISTAFKYLSTIIPHRSTAELQPSSSIRPGLSSHRQFHPIVLPKCLLLKAGKWSLVQQAITPPSPLSVCLHIPIAI